MLTTRNREGVTFAINSSLQGWNKRSFGGDVTACKTEQISSGVLDDGKLSLKDGRSTIISSFLHGIVCGKLVDAVRTQTWD